MRIVGISYREWAFRIYHNIMERTPHLVHILRESDYDNIIRLRPKYILYYGWSDYVDQRIIERFKCIMLHPAPLPLYRGGSPIQNQIIRGEKESMVTLFRMDGGIDTGDIIAQEPLDLRGHLNDIFYRIIEIGTRLTVGLIDGIYESRPQDHSKSTFFKRRTPEMSELTMDELKTESGEYLFNKCRMLEDPYPNAFIRTSDGKKLLIKRAELW